MGVDGLCVRECEEPWLGICLIHPSNPRYWIVVRPANVRPFFIHYCRANCIGELVQTMSMPGGNQRQRKLRIVVGGVFGEDVL
jgi:hypothetical protein